MGDNEQPFYYKARIADILNSSYNRNDPLPNSWITKIVTEAEAGYRYDWDQAKQMAIQDKEDLLSTDASGLVPDSETLIDQLVNPKEQITFDDYTKKLTFNDDSFLRYYMSSNPNHYQERTISHDGNMIWANFWSEYDPLPNEKEKIELIANKFPVGDNENKEQYVERMKTILNSDFNDTPQSRWSDQLLGKIATKAFTNKVSRVKK